MEIGNTRRFFLVIVSLLEVLLFGGLHYGWASLLLILMDEGLFLDLCQRNATLIDNITITNKTINSVINSCVERDERFNLIFALSFAFVMALSILFGYLHFKLGIKLSRILSKIIFVGGALLIGFSSKELPWLVLPGLIMVGSAGLSLMVSNMQITQVLNKGSSTYVGVMNGCYDSSSIVQLVIKVLYQQSVSKLYSYIGLSIIFVILTSTCTVLHPSLAEKEKEKHKKDTDINFAKKKEAKSNNNLPSLCTILWSRPFLMHLMWASCILLRFSYYLGAIYSHIESTVGSNKVNHFTNILGYVMFGGGISSFLAGHFTEMQKMCFREPLQKVLPLTLTSLLAIAISSLSFVNDPKALYASFVCVTFLRSFLFCMVMDFIIFMFPKEYMTVLYSTNVTLTGLLSLLQYALFSWGNKYLGALLHVNILCLCVSVISLAHPLLIIWMGIKNGSNKDDRQNSQVSYNGVTASIKRNEKKSQTLKQMK